MAEISALRLLKSRIDRSRFLRNCVGICDLAAMKLRGVEQRNMSISFCTTVKDRFDHVKQTLTQNMFDNLSYSNCDFVLLDYDCPDPRTRDWVETEMKPYLEAGRLNYYYFPNSPKYQMAHSRNLAFRLASGEILCNVDADNFIGKGFASYVSRVLSTDGVFIQGPRDGRGLGGRLCVRRKDWAAVGGYDERLKDWGADDDDLANRLCMLGLRRKLIRLEKFCNSISHGDELRTRYCTRDKETSAREQRRIMNENLLLGIICPTPIFGHGRVQKNFSEWIEV